MLMWNFMLPTLPDGKNCHNPTIPLVGMRELYELRVGTRTFLIIKVN